MHHNYIIFPRSPSRYKHPCFLSCCCFRTSQKTARFCPFLDHRTVNLNRHPAVWLIIVPDMPTVSRARIPAQQHQGGPLWAPSRTSIRPRSDPSTNASSDTDALNNMKAPRLLKAIKTQPLPSPHCAASPPSPTPRMATHRRRDLEVIWPAPPKPSTPGAASGRRSVRASLRLHVSWQLGVHTGAPRLPLTPPTCVWCRAVVGDAAAPSCGGFALFLLSGGQKRDRGFPLLAEGGTAAMAEVHDGKSPALIHLYCIWMMMIRGTNKI